jgi:hypothetical protein
VILVITSDFFGHDDFVEFIHCNSLYCLHYWHRSRVLDKWLEKHGKQFITADYLFILKLVSFFSLKIESTFQVNFSVFVCG